ncbi:Cyclic nucleotide-gated potassium channel [bacterium HR36]|nr:Cyclic nucleotide-gated potassium channel [bacterium HR36]
MTDTLNANAPTSWPARLWRILQVENPDDSWTRWLNSGLTVLILVNVAAVVLETVQTLADRYAAWFGTIEVASVAIFTVEYVARLWTCTYSPLYRHPWIGRLKFTLTPMALVDLLAILPFSAGFVTYDLRFLRALRLLRLARLAKLGRYSAAMQIMARALRRCREELVLTAGLMVVLILTSASLIYLAEHESQPDKFPDILAAMWWSVITLTTVGYGDVYPVTPLGKVFAGVVSLFGVGMVALPAGVLGASLLEEIRASRQQLDKRCPHCGQPLE